MLIKVFYQCKPNVEFIDIIETPLFFTITADLTRHITNELRVRYLVSERWSVVRKMHCQEKEKKLITRKAWIKISP